MLYKINVSAKASSCSYRHHDLIHASMRWNYFIFKFGVDVAE
jgi:hypothetical protein